jgi:ribose 5-phosphate isomerase B
MRVGIATDHDSFGLKDGLVKYIKAAGYEVVDFGAGDQNPEEDDYPDFVIPLAQAVARGRVERGIAIGGCGVGVSVCANKVPGVRAALIQDSLSAWQAVDEDYLNIICVNGRAVRPYVAWEVVRAFLVAQFSRTERNLRRLEKVSYLEQTTNFGMGIADVPNN